MNSVGWPLPFLYHCGVNFALGPHPNWPVLSGYTSAGKLTSSSGCGLSAPCWLGTPPSVLAESEEQINFSQDSPKILFKMTSESFESCFVVVFRSFSQNFLLGAPELGL